MTTTLFDDAVKAYQKYCHHNNLVFLQPSEGMSDIDREYVHLNNTNGELARYVIATGEILEP